MTVASYRDLHVWKSGVELALQIYKINSEFPNDERFGLVSQMRRCGISIPSNIAEGHARLSTREFIRFVSIALGSLAELETQLQNSSELGYIKVEVVRELLTKSDCLGKQLRSLTRSLRQRVND